MCGVSRKGPRDGSGVGCLEWGGGCGDGSVSELLERTLALCVLGPVNCSSWAKCVKTLIPFPVAAVKSFHWGKFFPMTCTKKNP